MDREVIMMTQRFRHKQYSLLRQIVLPMLALVILTALAVGLPAILVVNDQLGKQARARLEQGYQTTHILISNKLNDLSYLALLTAQRPTLQRLVLENDLVELDEYLEIFRQGASLDAVLLCDGSSHLIWQVGEFISNQACQVDDAAIIGEEGPEYQGWMLASQFFPEQAQDIRVVVGTQLDDDFASQLREETGFEQILIFEGRFLAASFPEGNQVWQSLIPEVMTVHSELIQYYSLRQHFASTGLETVVSLAATEFINARRLLNLVIGGSIALVVLAGSTFGIIRARQISRPLELLRDSAEKLRHGDLTTPIRVESSVRELALLSYVLDDARTTLNHSISELRNEKAWIDHLLESVVEGIITLDRVKNITFFSRGAEQITGWIQDDVLLRPVDDIIHLFETEGSFSQRLPAPGSKQIITIKNRSGKPTTLAITGASLAPPESGKGATVLVLRDVSSEESIRRLLGDFLSNITHEFRTPLTALAASSELLLDQLQDLEQDELAGLLNNIHLGILNLQTLIDNLLEGASIETGRFRVFVQPTDLSLILNEAVHTMQPLAEKYGIDIQTNLPSEIPPVAADSRRTTQVLLNLLSNAIKWGASRGSIVVSAQRIDNFIEVSVSDQGPGVPLELQTSLFHPFPKGESGSQQHQGAGLGLSVVKAIVEAQGGSVGLRDRPGGGAIFWFTLPEALPQAEIVL
jgi:two-component system, OmpR family, sensor histidine kinase ResE